MDAYIIQLFFKTVFIVITFSLLHGIIFLPILLTIVVPNRKTEWVGVLINNNFIVCNVNRLLHLCCWNVAYCKWMNIEVSFAEINDPCKIFDSLRDYVSMWLLIWQRAILDLFYGFLKRLKVVVEMWNICHLWNACASICYVCSIDIRRVVWLLWTPGWSYVFWVSVLIGANKRPDF